MKKSQRAAKQPDSEEVPPAFAPVVAAFAMDRQVSRARRFSSNSVLSVQGKIFAMMVRGKFVVKLPKQRVDELVGSGAGEYFDPGHGRLMKEWVALASGNESWVGLAKEAQRFVKETTARTARGPGNKKRLGHKTASKGT